MRPDAPVAPATDGADGRGFSYLLNAGATDVRATMEDIRHRLRRAEVNAEMLGRVELVLAELLNNVVEHAHRDSPDGRIEVAVEVGDDAGVNVDIHDDGRPMPGGEPPAGRLPDLDVAVSDLPEGGFGWFLIRNLCEELVYRRQETGNFTGLRFRPRPDEAA